MLRGRFRIKFFGIEIYIKFIITCVLIFEMNILKLEINKERNVLEKNERIKSLTMLDANTIFLDFFDFLNFNSS